MNFLSLKYFIVIAECASFTKAAEKLYISQPTLSRHISLLEQELNVLLFERSKRSLNLTEAGQMLLPEATKIIEHCERVEKMIRGSQKDIVFSLSIGYQTNIDNHILNEAIRDVSRKNENYSFQFYHYNFDELRHSLEKGESDIIFTISASISNLSGIATACLSKGNIQVAVPIDHPLAQRCSVKLSDLADEQFVFLERNMSSAMIDIEIGLCRENGFEPKVFQCVRDGQALLYLVGSGHGIAFIVSTSFLSFPDNIKILDLKDCGTEFDLVAAWMKNNKNPALPLFLAEVRKNVRMRRI